MTKASRRKFLSGLAASGTVFPLKSGVFSDIKTKDLDIRIFPTAGVADDFNEDEFGELVHIIRGSVENLYFEDMKIVSDISIEEAVEGREYKGDDPTIYQWRDDVADMQSDVSLLLGNFDWEWKSGQAFLDTNASAVYMAHPARWERTIMTILHEIGHSLGFRHDDGEVNIKDGVATITPMMYGVFDTPDSIDRKYAYEYNKRTLR